ncbi:MAG TPA: TetR family transcriptional regulator [Acidimicrobiales bacterium]|nr:TetR family transcriptional regulator [Acidimicrobiales bacterium]
MAKRATATLRIPTDAPRTRRLTAEARRKSILEAARHAFSQNGDMNGTTVKVIAQHAGISEGVIYRHFESKDQLFYEAVVEPLRDAVDDLVAFSSVIDRDGPLNRERQLQTLADLYQKLTSTLEEVLPLLGLVLFGDPKVARRFYHEHFGVAMDRLADAWREVADRHGLEFELLDMSARAVMGTALILALESHHSDRFDRDRAVALVSEGTMTGYFPKSTRKNRRQ